MLDTGSPPRPLDGLEKNDDGEDLLLATVSPPSSHHVSRSSTPGISSLDGTPRYLDNPLPPPPRPRSAPPLQDMAIKPVTLSQQEPQFHHGQVNFSSAPTGKVLPPTMESIHRSPAPSPAQRPVADEDQRRRVTPLSEISQLLRLQKYHKRRCHQAEDHLHCLQIAAARTSRLVRLSRSIQHTLAECIRSEDKNSFINLLHAFHDACDDALRTLPTPGREYESARSSVSFLGDLSPSSRAAVLELLAKVRYDGTFVANRLASLSPKELVALLPERTNTRATESVFGGAPRINSRTSKPLGFVVDAQVDLLSTYGYSSPLETLMFASGGLNKNGSSEDGRATDIWASVCAKLVSEQKSGSERMVPAVLDIWASSISWPGKDRLEVWILQTLQRGAFVLEQPTKPTFRARIEGRSDVSPEEEHRTESFYSNAVDSLLDLLGERTGPSILPPGALRMCHAIWEKLSPFSGHQSAFPQFVLVRWLFSFVTNVVALPESHGLLTDYYVSDNARQRILREVASRAQKAAFEVAYSWRHGISPAAETIQRVSNIMVRFQPSRPDDSPKGSSSQHSKPLDSADTFLVISAKDVVVSLNALYPQRRPASVSSDGDNLKSGLQSSASSISGFSLFSQAKTLEPHSEVHSPSSQDTNESFGSVETVIANLELEVEETPLNSAHMREVCLELEDLLTRTAPTKDAWDVLTAPADDSSLLTMRSKLLQASSISKGLRDGSVTPCGEKSLTNISKEHTTCRRAVEWLLQSNDILHCSTQSTGLQALEAAEQTLGILFEQTIQESEERGDFVKAHTCFQQFHDFQSYVLRSADMSSLRDLLVEIELNARSSMSRALKLQDSCEAWIRNFSPIQQLQSECLRPLLDENERLRDKMWYVADVRTSAPYDEARSVASALRVMGKPKRLARTRLSPPLRHWSASKLSSTNMHLKTEAQILEILSAKPDHGGPNKLSDDQSKATQLWMDRQNVDNLCKGEERLHKLCMEIRKCVDQIVATPPEGSTIWSNTLFARDVAFRQHQSTQRKPSLLAGLTGAIGQHGFLSLSSQLRSTDGLSSASHTLSNASSRDYLDSRSPTLASKSSMPFWSPAMTEVDSPSSATSIGDSHAQLEHPVQKSLSQAIAPERSSLDQLRHRATSLVLSDLTSTLFNDGSETDHAFWTGLGRDLTDRHFRGLHAFHASIGSQTPTMDSNARPRPSISRFSFDAAFSTLLQKFSALSNPSTKLACLYDIDRLLVPYMAEQAANDSPSLSFVRTNSELGPLVHEQRNTGSTETSVAGFRNVFSKSTLRPLTIFRDLQYIAALLPSSTLHNTPEGKAFCNAAVAITSLKQEARAIMVETADSIIAYHSNNRGHGRSSSTAQQQRDSATFAAPSRTPSAEEVSRYSMADAAYLLQITAKEGDAVAQRELATLYLTHPELMDRIIAPFARTRDVFKEELESKWRKNQDPNRCDPTTMCVAHHWMSLSSKAGDSLAKEILRQREEMDSF